MKVDHDSPGTGGHSCQDMHAEAVTRAIQFMRQRLGESQELRTMAEAAILSPFHFHRVFRAATGAPPGRFLTALRMATAKSLLLETKLSATDVSIAVGYSSFGTFTSQFTRLVGVTPGRFRKYTAGLGDMPVRELLHVVLPRPAAGGLVHGWMSDRPDQSKGVTLIGLFTSGIPQERPLSCALTDSPGPVEMPCGGLSGYFAALAVSMSREATLRDVLTEQSAAGLYVGAHHSSVRLGPGVRAEEFSIQLRPMRLTDPPVLGAFPLLLATERDREEFRPRGGAAH